MDAILAKMKQEGLLSDAAEQRVRALMKNGVALDEAILQADGVPEDKLLRFLAGAFEVPYVELETFTPAKDFLAAFPAGLLVQHRILPIEERDGVVTVASSRLCDPSGIDELRLAVGKDIQCALAPSQEIERCIRRLDHYVIEDGEVRLSLL